MTKPGRGWAAVVVGVLMLGGVAAARAQEDPAVSNGGPGGLPAGSQMVRGTVTAATGDALTVKAETGEVYRVTVTSNTRMMKARQPVKLADVKAGDGLGAMGVMDPQTKTLHAVFVTVLDAEQIKKAQADLGKTYIAGEVTAIDELKLTIKRADGVSQTIGVDEGTSFRKGGRGMRMLMNGSGSTGEAAPGAGRQAGSDEGGESITLADIKVGNSVVGRGALKSGVFVPTELRVMEAGARRRRGGGNGNAPSEGAGAGNAAPPAGAPR